MDWLLYSTPVIKHLRAVFHCLVLCMMVGPFGMTEIINCDINKKVLFLSDGLYIHPRKGCKTAT